MGSGASKDSIRSDTDNRKLWKQCETVFECVSAKLPFEEALGLLPEVMHLLRDVPSVDWTSLDTHKLLFFIRAYSGPLPNIPLEQRLKWVEALYREDIMFLFCKWWRVLFVRGMFNKAHEDKLRNMRMVIGIGWNCVEVSEDCCQSLVSNNGFVRLINALHDSSLSPKKLQEDRSNVSRLYTAHACATMILIVLKTLCEAKAVFRKANGLNIVKKYVKSSMDIIKCKVLLILAYGVNEDEYDLLGNQDQAIEYLLKLLNDCLSHSDHIGRLYPFMAIELIDGMNKVAANDENKRKLVRHGILESLSPVLHHPVDNKELLSALDVIWTMAFHPENKLKLLNLCQLIQKLRKLREHEDKCVVRSASGILFTLGLFDPKLFDVSGQKIAEPEVDLDEPRFADDEEEDGDALYLTNRRQSMGSMPLPPAPLLPSSSKIHASLPALSPTAPTRPSTSGGRDKGHVMISYQWGYKPLVLTIKQHLVAGGCNVWMDVDQMRGSTLEAMALAVEKASVVIICYSESYKNSPSCRTEAEYTYKLRKRLIPVRMQANYVADGWLGIMIGTKLYFDMSTNDKLQLNMHAFLRELTGTDQTEGPLSMQGTAVVANWTQTDVQKWLTDLNMVKLTKMLAAFDGKTLLALKRMCAKAPTFYYTSLKNDLGLKDMVLMLKFTNALETL